MKLYLVRLKDNKEPVGIFYTDLGTDMFWVVDECTDPHACEYTEMPHGGIMWAAPTKLTVPLFYNPDKEDDDEADFNFDEVNLTDHWHRVFYKAANETDKTKWKPVVPLGKSYAAATGLKFKKDRAPKAKVESRAKH